ncbi:uncharacterized protein Z518_01813 [Rhinocladiella mackenziei CBS 650.93]|uniref:Rhinocladiella mackenziei CBS 650.93 unplaced genomic scaffold supercont1.2, whole genome shotgun sequence n=1 Tax=Rhinocladiella mackenziei CBS 650.93 TaxID=1442369 RepID=A0A0D2JDB3_9EURO|nr:uncharacterized protein Z518_01813 [Rhinocladiella mackenziei CBS 650.93]KIX07160.1 hypothetical protein Z518_01813 [Rhinocladiella mackenziei CBS 650.93]
MLYLQREELLRPPHGLPPATDCPFSDIQTAQDVLMAQEAEASLDISDSTLGSDESTYTESLRSSLLQSVRENGRAYHRYRDGHYILPDDERERDRLDMQHEMCLRTFGRKLILAPIENHSINNVLDIGTGTGIWAIDFADEHPESNVIGTDLSPMQPTLTPPNCRFIVDDFEDQWSWTDNFDLVHGRMLLTSFRDGKRLIQQAYDSLKPGGWLEIQDVLMPVTSDDDSMKGSSFAQWQDLFFEATRKIGRDPEDVGKYDQWMREVGFQDVARLSYKWPQNPWPKDSFLKEMGAWNLVNILDGLEGFTLRPFMEILGMSFDDVQVLLAKAKQDVKNRHIHAYWNVFVFGVPPRSWSSKLTPT